MKSYTMHNQICMSGKAWEIRTHMKSLLKNTTSKHMTLKEYIHSVSPASELPRQLEQHNRPLRKKLDHHIIPFPLS
ncbi:Z-ring formation inhibitor MciZ [Chengkuizengella axinellae]|uniref:Z-ring formation inhibitor MciZ n=1 Tax=Chengkuizengella axinellae TaxID=3064388 RepID=UPI003529B960